MTLFFEGPTLTPPFNKGGSNYDGVSVFLGFLGLFLEQLFHEIPIKK